MPTRNFVILAFVAVVLAAAGLVLGTRGSHDWLHAVAKPAGNMSRAASTHEVPKTAKAKPVEVVNPKTAEEPKPASVGEETPQVSSATTPLKRFEFKPTDKSPEKPAAPIKETSTVANSSQQPGLGRVADNESELVFVSRKDLLRARNAANEAAAISTLRGVASAQAMAQSSGVIDTDADSQGEYGTFGELSGSVPCRSAPGERSVRMQPAILSSAFGQITKSGNVAGSGYFFRMYLPGVTASNKKVRGIPESAGGRSALDVPPPDANNAEVLWALYAWPIEAPTTGARAFFTNQEGDLLVIANADGMYSGEEHAPPFDAAFSANTPGDMAAPPVPGAKCNDGQIWSSLDRMDDQESEPPVELGSATQADLEMNARPDSERIVVSRTLLRRAHVSTNEARVMQTLRILDSAQAQIRSAGVIDTDDDSTGEYAFFAEMAGAVPCRASPKNKLELLTPPLLGSSFGKISSAGNLLRSGYVFRIYLPGRAAGDKIPGIAETGGGGAATLDAKPDHDNSENLWAVYAWPIEAGRSGARAFFLNQVGDLFSTPNADGAYGGEAHAPLFDAAYSAARPGDMAAPLPTAGTKSNDGRVWLPVS